MIEMYSEDIRWELSDAGVLSISGSGMMPNYGCGGRPEAPWEEYLDDVTEIVIGDGITRIGSGAFISCINLERLVLADSVEQICGEAFVGCGALREVDAGGREFIYVYDVDSDRSVPHIIFGVNCFAGSPWLRAQFGLFYIRKGNLYFNTHHVCNIIDDDQIRVPEGVRVIKPFAMRGAYMELILPESLEVIEDMAFANAWITRRLRIPGSVREIGEYAFADSRFGEGVSLPAGLRDRKLIFERYVGMARQRSPFPQTVGAYSLGSIPAYEMPRIRKLMLKRNHEVHHKDGSVTTVNEKPFHVGEAVYHRLCRHDTIMVITWEGDKVQSVRSMFMSRDYGPLLYTMYPAINHRGQINARTDAVEEIDRDYIVGSFGSYDGTQAQAGELRSFGKGRCEEWYVTKGTADAEGPFEFALLYSWLHEHPDMKVRSEEEFV